MMTYSSYQTPTDIIYGKNSLDSLKNMELGRVCVVTEKVMVELGIINPILKILDNIGVDYHVFDEVEPDPSLKVVSKGIKHLIERKPETIVAVGGGSSLDTAKGILYFNLRLQEKILPKERVQKLKLVAIPTTSGTGSEVTSYAVITNHIQNRKIPITDRRIIPDVAILDTSLTATLPKKTIADSGIDVFTHALEAYVCKSANPFSSSYALNSLKMVDKNLLAMYEDVSNENARSNMHMASCLAGLAFESSSLGLNHGLAHALGAMFHIAHGRLNGMLLPYVIKYNTSKDGKINKNVMQRYAAVSEILELTGDDDEEKVKSLLKYISNLQNKLDIPTSLSKLSIDKDEYMSNIDKLVEATLSDQTTLGNPVEVSRQDAKNLYISIY